MPELKDTAASVAALKKREAELAEGRNALKQSILAQIDELTAQLQQLGFSYSLIEGNGTPKKVGRPRKETPNGQED